MQNIPTSYYKQEQITGFSVIAFHLAGLLWYKGQQQEGDKPHNS